MKSCIQNIVNTFTLWKSLAPETYKYIYFYKHILNKNVLSLQKDLCQHTIFSLPLNH